MKNKQGIQLAFHLRHQYSQQFITFARIFIANGIDKIHTSRMKQPWGLRGGNNVIKITTYHFSNNLLGKLGVLINY